MESSTPIISTTSLKKTASGESSSPAPRVNSPASRTDTGRNSSEGPIGWRVTSRMSSSGTSAKTRLISPEITVASGKTALGTGSLRRIAVFAFRLCIEATMLWLKKFQNRMPASAKTG